MSPFDVEDVVLVIRAFPIRVAGDSGTLPNETDWETVSKEGGWHAPLIEYTSVTKKPRRVARFDAAIVRQSIEVNEPSLLVLNHLDYVDFETLMAKKVTQKAEEFTSWSEHTIGRRIDLLGFGPSTIIERRKRIIFEAISA